jgi:hypothetical protein
MSAEVEYRSARAKASSDAIVQDATAQILCLLGPLWQQIHRLCLFHFYAMSVSAFWHRLTFHRIQQVPSVSPANKFQSRAHDLKFRVHRYCNGINHAQAAGRLGLHQIDLTTPLRLQPGSALAICIARHAGRGAAKNSLHHVLFSTTRTRSWFAHTGFMVAANGAVVRCSTR